MIFASPITGTKRNYPTHIAINGRCNNTTGFILCEQLKAIDYEKRGFRLIDRADDQRLAKVLEIIYLII